MALLCAHVAESLACRQGFGLPGFLPALDKLLEITAEVLNPTVRGRPSGDVKGHYCPAPPRLPGLGAAWTQEPMKLPR